MHAHRRHACLSLALLALAACESSTPDTPASSEDACAPTTDGSALPSPDATVTTDAPGGSLDAGVDGSAVMPDASSTLSDGSTDCEAGASDDAATGLEDASIAENDGSATVDGGAPDAAPPPPAALTSLALDGLSLAPPFDPSIHDYAVRCAAGSNPATVEASAPAGVSVTLVQPTVTWLAQPVRVVLAESDGVVVEATSADGSESDYWVRCLPHDFPSVVAARYGETTPGWYVTGNTTVASGEAGYAMVLDAHATPVWYHAVGSGLAAGYVTVVDTDTIAYIGVDGGRFGTNPAGHFDIVNLDTGDVTSVKTVGSALDEHELLPLENGDTLLLSYPATAGIDMSSRGITNTTTIADCSVQEIAPDGSLVWSWLGSDHFDVVKESTELAPGNIGPLGVVDPFHCNSIEVTPDGDVLLSVRQIDAVVRISRATGKVVWKLGGVPWNKDGAQILTMQGDTETSFYHQHDARLLPNGDVTLFDDHTTQLDTLSPAPNVARGMEIALDLNAGVGTVVWQFQATVASSATGSFRRYDDGSSVVGWGFLGNTKPALAMSEVDAAGNRLLEMSFAQGDHAYRVLKFPTDSLDIDVLRRTAGQ